MKILCALILFVALNARAAFTEFYCIKGTGTNVNSGHTQDANPTFTADSGNWTNATWTFFKTALNPVAGGVTNGAWASVCTNLTATNAWLVGMVTNASDTTDTIQLSQVAFMGVNPADRVSDCVIRVGGAWAGPNTNTMTQGGGFPFAFFATTATNAPNVFPRCNFKSGTTYGVSNAITHALNGPMRFQGYTSTPGDGGMATIDGGTIKPYYITLTTSCNGNDFVDLIFANNGVSSTAADLVSNSGARNLFLRCVFRDSGKNGFITTTPVTLWECEAYGNNEANSSGAAGINMGNTGGSLCVRCIAHDNPNSNTSGFQSPSGVTFIGCISDSNARHGVNFSAAATTSAFFFNCDFYNNAGSGIDISTTGEIGVIVENCNFLKNGSLGITSSGSSIKHGLLINCGFGSGTQTNTLGNIASNLGGIVESSSILYAADATPWVDPANGDFRINLAAAKSVGRGAFTETQASYSGTVGYPDIGAAQSASTNATTRATVFSQ